MRLEISTFIIYLLDGRSYDNPEIYFKFGYNTSKPALIELNNLRIAIFLSSDKKNCSPSQNFIT